MNDDKALTVLPAGGEIQSAYMPAMTMEVALARREAIIQFVKRIMVADVDYGTIPGTPKPTLLKPGAEKLVSFFGLEPHYAEVKEVLDWDGTDHGGEPLYYIRYSCKLIKDGRLWGSGEGSASSREAKYRYRWVGGDDVPEADKPKLRSRGGVRKIFEPLFAIDKAETGGKYGKPVEYWAKFQSAIESGKATKRQKTMRGKEYDGWEIEVDELQYRIPNPEFADTINTIQKMAMKRALVAATLIATSASDFFTQDMEDMGADAFPQQNTKAEQAEYAQQRIAEERAKAAAAKPAAPVETDDPELADFWSRMVGIPAIVKVFAFFKDRITTLTGADPEQKETHPYYQIIGKIGMAHGNDLKGKTNRQLKQTVKELLDYCRFAAEKPAPLPPRELEITDADIPF